MNKLKNRLLLSFLLLVIFANHIGAMHNEERNNSKSEIYRKKESACNNKSIEKIDTFGTSEMDVLALCCGLNTHFFEYCLPSFFLSEEISKNFRNYCNLEIFSDFSEIYGSIRLDDRGCELKWNGKFELDKCICPEKNKIEIHVKDKKYDKKYVILGIFKEQYTLHGTRNIWSFFVRDLETDANRNLKKLVNIGVDDGSYSYKTPKFDRYFQRYMLENFIRFIVRNKPFISVKAMLGGQRIFKICVKGEKGELWIPFNNRLSANLVKKGENSFEINLCERACPWDKTRTKITIAMMREDENSNWNPEIVSSEDELISKK